VADRNQELEDLIALVESPGFQWLKSYAAREWGAEAYREKVRKLLSALDASKRAEASDYILQLEHAARAIEVLIGAPVERIKRLQQQELARR
jgi:hypothetical protein